jgi:hypothetical protein
MDTDSLPLLAELLCIHIKRDSFTSFYMTRKVSCCGLQLDISIYRRCFIYIVTTMNFKHVNSIYKNELEINDASERAPHLFRPYNEYYNELSAN